MAAIALAVSNLLTAPVATVEARSRAQIMKDVRFCKDLDMYDGSIKHIRLGKKVTEEKAIQYIYNVYHDALQSAISRGFVPFGDVTYETYTSDPKGYYGINPVYDIEGVPYYWDKNRQEYVDKSGNSYPDNGYIYNSNGRRRRDDYYTSRSGYNSSAWQWAESIGVVTSSDRPHKAASHRWFYARLSDFAYYVDGSGTTFRRRNSGRVNKGDAARIMRLFVEERLDPDEIGRARTYTNSYNNTWNWW